MLISLYVYKQIITFLIDRTADRSKSSKMISPLKTTVHEGTVPCPCFCPGSKSESELESELELELEGLEGADCCGRRWKIRDQEREDMDQTDRKVRGRRKIKVSLKLENKTRGDSCAVCGL